ncbi:hypothetical protein B0H14DRAFT_3131705 [Mycena olivaceomarginata]|nr:hypothetical protein B0H14DRAFT_3131705 [Mycena olivaceomarginata]
MNMKSDSNASSGPHTSHPIAATAQALAEAVVNAQRAIDAARTEPSPEKIALAACRRECDSLQAKNTALIASSRTQLQEINRLQMRCEGLAADRDLGREKANAGDRQIVGLHVRLTATEAQLTSTEAALHQQRTAAERSRVELEHSAAREAALEEDLARLDRVRGTLARSRSRSVVKALKRSVELLMRRLMSGLRNAAGRRNDAPNVEGNFSTQWWLQQGGLAAFRVQTSRNKMWT